jgi:hypothetical protein
MTFQLDPELRELERKLRSLKPKHVSVPAAVVRKRQGRRWSAAVLTLAGSVFAVVCLVCVPKQDVPDVIVPGGNSSRLVSDILTPRQQLRQMIDEMGLRPKTLPAPDYPVVEIVVTDRPYQLSVPTVLTVRKLRNLN